MTEPLRHAPCNLCGADDPRVLHHASSPLPDEEGRAYHPSVDDYATHDRIVQCRRCGLVYADPVAEEAFILEQYRQVVDRLYVAEAHARAINFRRSVRTIQRFCPTGRVLDVGCAAGIFLHEAQETGWEVAGLDMSEWFVQYARDTYGLSLQRHPLLAAPFAPGGFDAVALMDVLEHLSQPKENLRRARELLRPGGLLYLTTPDYDSVVARLFRERWWCIRKAHIFYFSRRTLRRMLAEAGFEVLQVSTYGRTFSLGYWLGRIAHFNRPLFGFLFGLVRGLGLARLPVPVNLGDQMEVVARSRA